MDRAVLIVSDDLALVRQLEREFTEAGANLTVVASVRRMVPLKGTLFDAVVLGWENRWRGGLHLLLAIKKQWPRTPVFAVSQRPEQVGLVAHKHGVLGTYPTNLQGCADLMRACHRHCTWSESHEG